MLTEDAQKLLWDSAVLLGQVTLCQWQLNKLAAHTEEMMEGVRAA